MRCLIQNIRMSQKIAQDYLQMDTLVLQEVHQHFQKVSLQ